MDKPGNVDGPSAGSEVDSLQALDLFLDSISQLSIQCEDRNEFYSTLVSRLPQIAGGYGAMVLAHFSGRMNVAYYGPNQLNQSDEKHSVSKLCQLLSADASEFSSDSGNDNPSNAKKGSSKFLSRFEIEGREYYVAVSYPVGQPDLFFAFVRQEITSAADQQIYADLVEEIGNLIVGFEERCFARAQQVRLNEIQKLTQLLLNMTNSSNYKKMAFNLVNDLAQFMQADRVCLFEANGKFVTCSGVSAVSKKSRIIRVLGSLARNVARKTKTIAYYPGAVSDEASDSFAKLQDVVALNDAKAIFVNSISRDRRSLGVITAEFLGETEVDWIDRNRRFESVLDLSVPVFEKTKQIHSIPMLGVTSWLFETVFGRPVRTLLLLALGAAMAVFLFVFASSTFVDFEIKSRGILYPIEVREVFASAAGTVDKVYVAEGSNVAMGDPVALIHSDDLEVKLTKANGDLDEANQQLAVLKLSEITGDDTNPNENSEVKRARIASEIKRQEIRISTIEKTLQLLEQQQKQLKVTSPIRGQVTSRKIETTLRNRPVSQGDPLLQVADLESEWEILLDVDEQKISYVIEAFERAKANGNDRKVLVRLRFTSAPTEEYEGTVREIDFVANKEQKDADHAKIRVRVDVDETQVAQLLRMGAGVDARIHCGEKNYLFLFTYEIRDKIREILFF